MYDDTGGMHKPDLSVADADNYNSMVLTIPPPLSLYPLSLLFRVPSLGAALFDGLPRYNGELLLDVRSIQHTGNWPP